MEAEHARFCETTLSTSLGRSHESERLISIWVERVKRASRPVPWPPDDIFADGRFMETLQYQHENIPAALFMTEERACHAWIRGDEGAKKELFVKAVLDVFPDEECLSEATQPWATKLLVMLVAHAE